MSADSAITWDVSLCWSEKGWPTDDSSAEFSLVLRRVPGIDRETASSRATQELIRSLKKMEPRIEYVNVEVSEPLPEDPSLYNMQPGDPGSPAELLDRAG